MIVPAPNSPDDRYADLVPTDDEVSSDEGLVTASFRTPFGWSSGHLQTVRSRVVRRRFPLARYGSRRVVSVDLADGTGDRLLVQVHRTRTPRPHAPLVVLVHGLGGSATSDYVVATALGFLRAGFPVARVDLRSAGLSALTTRNMYHAGRTADLRRTIHVLQSEPESAGGIAVMGFSLGGAATLKMLGEPMPGLRIRGAVAVSPPLDLTEGAKFLNRAAGGAYEKFLVRRLRRESTKPGPGGDPILTPGEEARIRHARSLPEFDDVVTAPRNGWADAAEYYRVNSAMGYLARITTPTLVIHSLDDPMIPPGPVRRLDWDSLARQGVRREITPRGGHVGFHERGNPLPWYVERAVRFFESELRSSAGFA